MSAATFAPSKAALTKANIVADVNGTFDDCDAETPYVALLADDVLDSEAQDFADRAYKWLQDVVGLSEDEAMEMDEDWMREWHDAVRARINSGGGK